MEKAYFISILVILFCGENVLNAIGWNFNGVSFFMLIYPYFYVLLALTIYIISKKSRTNSIENKAFVNHALIILSGIFVFKSFILKDAGYVTSYINAFVIPILVCYTSNYYIKRSRSNQYKLCKCVEVFFIVECCLAIFERIINWNTFEVVENSTLIAAGEFRSSALQAHFLSNALIVCIVMNFMLVSKMQAQRKVLFIGLGFLALLCFNSRAAIVIEVISVVFYFFTIILKSSRRNNKEKKYFLYMVFATLLALPTLISMGWGGRLFATSTFVKDDNFLVRMRAIDMFDYISWDRLLFGIEPTMMKVLMARVNIPIIENFWIVFVFYYGIILSIILLFVYWKIFSIRLKNFSTISILINVGTFIFISSTNNSLSAGIPALSFFILCTYIYNNKSYANITRYAILRKRGYRNNVGQHCK